MSIRLTLLLALAALLLTGELLHAPRSVTAEDSTPRRREANARDDDPKITPRCRQSIERGTKWLLSAMRHDGAFGIDEHGDRDLACTSIVGMALLSQGNTPLGGKYHRELTRVLDSVLDMVERVPADGHHSEMVTLVQRKIGRNADYFLAGLFLSQALGEAGDADAEIRPALQKLVRIICQSQGGDGTWGDQSWAPVLGTVLGWESLCASRSSGMHVDASAKLAGDALLKKIKLQDVNEEDWMHSFYKKASSIRVLYSLNLRNEPAFHDCVKKILGSVNGDERLFTQAGGEEYMAFFLVTECLLQGQETSWNSWYPTVSNKLIAVQNSNGSWSGHHCITGRTFCTAAALLTLQAADFCLPTSDL